MCLIIDVHCVSLTFASSQTSDFEPVRSALITRRAVAIYGGKLAQEYFEIARLRRFLLELNRQGILQRVKDEDVDEETQKVIAEGLCVSDDHHIIALARVSATRLLCSHDQDLHADFTNPRILNRPRGKVYQMKEHEPLIREHCAKKRPRPRRT